MKLFDELRHTDNGRTYIYLYHASSGDVVLANKATGEVVVAHGLRPEADGRIHWRSGDYYRPVDYFMKKALAGKDGE
jgi:hypothetical protein